MVAKMKFNSNFYREPEYFKKFYESDIIKSGVILEVSDSNKYRFDNEVLWFLIMWDDGKITWEDNNNLVVINESR